MTVEDVENRLQEISVTIHLASSERDELIRQLRGIKSSRSVAGICGRSHAYVCRIWRETNDA